MTSSQPKGFSEETVEFEAGLPSHPAHGNFVQAERDRLRAGVLDTAAVEILADPRVGSLSDWPSPPIDTVTTHQLSRFKELWFTRHQSAVGKLQRGSGLHIDLGSGLYVTGKNRLEASDRFREIFGPDRSALCEEVGVPLTLGSGLWALQSEA